MIAAIFKRNCDLRAEAVIGQDTFFILTDAACIIAVGFVHRKLANRAHVTSVI